jgi:hypothetical protein
MELQGIDPREQKPDQNTLVLALIRQGSGSPRISMAAWSGSSWQEMPNYAWIDSSALICWAAVPSLLPPDKPKGRNIGEVLDRMIAAAAPDQALCASLRTVGTSIGYTPPESMVERWQELMLIINLTFPKPQDLAEWQKDVIEALTGKRP